MQVLLVPLHGHSSGHCGIAIGDGEKWAFHCGDLVALDAIKTPSNTLAARPLGPHYAKLHALSTEHTDNVQIVQSHYLVNKIPEFKSW